MKEYSSGVIGGGQTTVPVTETEISNPFIESVRELCNSWKFSDADIPREVLEMITKAGIYAPSGHNCQTWKFTVIRKKAEIEMLESTLKEIKVKKAICFDGFQSPKALILLSNDRRNPYGIQDVSCAAQNMMLAAGSYRIVSMLSNPLRDTSDEKQIRDRLDLYGVPREHIVWICISLGYAEKNEGSLYRNENVVNHIRS